MSVEKQCINCGIWRCGYDEDEICECPDIKECIEELKFKVEKMERAGERLKDIAKTYAMQSYDRSGTTRKAIEIWEQSLSSWYKISRNEEV